MKASRRGFSAKKPPRQASKWRHEYSITARDRLMLVLLGATLIAYGLMEGLFQGRWSL